MTQRAPVTLLFRVIELDSPGAVRALASVSSQSKRSVEYPRLPTSGQRGLMNGDA